MRLRCECDSCHPARIEAYLGWGTIAIFVLSFDVVAKKVGGMTLSEGWRRMRAHPARHALLTLIWGLLTLHLFERGTCACKKTRS